MAKEVHVQKKAISLHITQRGPFDQYRLCSLCQWCIPSDQVFSQVETGKGTSFFLCFNCTEKLIKQEA